MVDVPLSPLTHKWLIVSGIFSGPSYLILIGRIEEKRRFQYLYFSFYVTTIVD